MSLIDGSIRVEQLSGTCEGFSSGLNLPPAQRNFIAALLSGVNVEPPQASAAEWQDFLQHLRYHWILPLLYWKVGRLPGEFHLPAKVVDQLREAFLSGSGRWMQTVKQLRKIVAASQKRDVDVLVLKGPALAPWLYPHPATRIHSDIDLLVRPGQIPLAREILEGLGYRCAWSKFGQGRLGRLYKHEEFWPGPDMSNCLQVELHWNFDPAGPLNEVKIDEIFSRAVNVNKSLLRRDAPLVASRDDNLAFKTLCPVDFLIACAIHMGIHSNDPVMRLIWIYDIALLAGQLNKPDDWLALQERSVSWRGRIAVERALKSAVKWTGLKIPPPFDDFSGWPKPAGADYQLLSPKRQLKAISVLINDPTYGHLQKTLTFARLVFPPPSHMKQGYAPSRPWLLPFSYGRRWLHWAGKLIGS